MITATKKNPEKTCTASLQHRFPYCVIICSASLYYVVCNMSGDREAGREEMKEEGDELQDEEQFDLDEEEEGEM